MSSRDDNQDNGLPVPNENRKTSIDFLPRFFKTESNKKFLQSTLDQLIQPGVAEKLNGYFGRKTAKAFAADDNYIPDVSSTRENYQFEPAAVIKDDLDNVVFYKDYNDYVNQISAFGGDVSNHSLLNKQESYSWNPNIDWDKIVNYRDYYWLPNGPVSVPVRGQTRDVISTYSVRLTGGEAAPAYLFSPDGLTSNPRLTLYRGQTYRFDIDTPGYPIAFAISRTVVPGTALLVAGREGIRGGGLYDSDLYDAENYDIGDFIVPPDPGSISFEADENVSTLYQDGVSKFNEDGDEVAVVFVEKGTIEFTIPFNAPDRLFYISKYDINVSGIMSVANIEENTFLDVEADIVGKKTYQSANGVKFTNGQKVKFTGTVVPEKYSVGDWYVEGVGDQIKLIRDSDLIIPAQYSEDLLVPFDSEPFDVLPFSDGSGFARNKDYIVINRASNDRNAWSRYNRWFHRQVIEQSFRINKLPFNLNEDFRAKRPIIEFEPGLRLFNYGTFAKDDVDLVDTFTRDVFSIIEGSIGYSVDKVDLAQGMRVLFVADTDKLVNGKIYTVNFIEIDGERQISLVETEDSQPLDLETVFVKQGAKNAGKTYYYENGSWKLAQEKTKTNQEPLFDLCCPGGREFADSSIFDSTAFRGTKIFSYKKGDGVVDSELGFAISYRNIDNTGDIVFDFNLLTDTFTIQDGEEQRVIKTDTSYLRKYSDRENFRWVNGYSSVPTVIDQPVLRQYIVDEFETEVFEVDVFDNAALIDDLKIRVFVNNKFKIKNQHYTVDRINNKLFVRFFDQLNQNDTVLIKSSSQQPKNSNGFYEFPYNLERNPNNQDPTDFTLGEIIDHVDSMIEKIIDFQGEFPGSSNLRDLGDLDHYGTRFVKHTGPINLPLYHITNKNFNLVKAIRYSKKEYSKFKRNFVKTATELGFDGNTKQHVDKIFAELNKDRVKTEPFYFSDMLPLGTDQILEYEILDPDNLFYNLSKTFSLSKLSPRSVLVYLNEKLLVAHKDYSFNDDGFLLLTANQQLGDILTIYEYETTDGSFVPPTPSKLGLYPRFEPSIVVDDTYVSTKPDLTTAYQIYGQTDRGDLGWFYPVYQSKFQAEKNDSQGKSVLLKLNGLSEKLYLPADQSLKARSQSDEFEEYPVGVAMIQGHDGSLVRAYKDYRDFLLLELETRIYNNIKINYNNGFLNINDFVGGFYRNTGFSKKQIDKSLLTDFIEWVNLIDQDYTTNDFYDRQNKFTYNYASMNGPSGETLPGFWRGIYIQAFDTDRPHTHPWEMLGFSIKPEWWEQSYGPAPYTKDNLILWEDLEAGIIREPNKAVRVDQRYIRPGLTDNIPVDTRGQLLSPLAANFAKNFFFRFVQENFQFGDHAPTETAWRRSSEYPFSIILAWLVNNPAQLVGLGFDVSRISRNFADQLVYTETGKPLQLDKLVFPNTVKDDQRIQTSGLVNYIYNLVASNVLKVYDDYRNEVKKIQNNLGIKIGGFTEKSKFRLLLDSRSPQQTVESSAFVPEENFEIFLNTSSPIDVVSYSAVLIEKTASGFVVKGYNQTEPYFKYYKPIKTANDITVNVGGISERTTQWRAQRPYTKGQIIENNNKFYRVVNDFTSGTVFTEDNIVQLTELPIVGGKRAQLSRNFDRRRVLELNYGTKLSTSQEVIDFILGYADYLKQAGFNFNYFNPMNEVVENWEYSAREFLFWTTQGWAEGSTISLSASASELSFTSQFSVVDDLYNGFYDYTILRANGRPLDDEFNNVFRERNNFTLKTKNTDDGIYHIKLPLVQKEHVVLLDNKTVFNDLIYQPSTGYRQERIKVLGFRTDDWTGSLNVPGFVFDEVNITSWESWKDYKIGDVVKHKEFYYVATENVPGSLVFENRFWFRLNQKPESKLMTNFDYRINQFTDFYDLDSDGFDTEQQRLAQHLIGYQKRKYLENIVNDEVSQFKFYQGYIREKGTVNSINKLFDALDGSSEESFEIYEEWAVQTGQYGAVDSFEQVEIQIDDAKIKESPQAFELVNELPSEVFDNVYRIRPFELYEQPVEYNSRPFPATVAVDEFLPTNGYVDINTVRYRVDNKIELATADANQITVNDYIWLLDDGRENWTVLQYFESIARAESLINTREFDDQGLPLWSIEINSWARSLVQPGDFVAIKAAQFYGVFGFYEVDSVEFNRIKIKVNVNNVFAEFENERFVVTALRSVRVEDIDQLNQKVQDRITLDQKVWVDQFDENNNWAVLQNISQFVKNNETSNPEGNIDRGFASIFDSSDDNRTLFVSSPFDRDGRVYQFRRTEDKDNFVSGQVFESVFNRFDVDDSKFGAGLAVSQDGKFLAVGSPDASNVKTKFKGEFDQTSEYNKGDIVKYKESLWKAKRRILPQAEIQEFNTFNSFDKLNDLVSDDLSLMLVGNPGLTNSVTQHILVRAPLDQYQGSKENDRIFLKWNRSTLLNDTLSPVEPFNGKITEFNAADFISKEQGHEIKHKVDAIFFVRSYVNVPLIGETVNTVSGSAQVVYTASNDDDLVIYVNNINGIIDFEGDLFLADQQQIGRYDLRYSFVNNEVLGGLWFIETTSAYNNLDLDFDQGLGLVYRDLIPETTVRIDNFYFNIQDTALAVGEVVNERQRPSRINHLSYRGNPGSEPLDDQLSNIWLFRKPNGLTLNQGDDFDFRVLNKNIDLSNTGFTFEILNGTHTVADVWNGYIDLRFTNFDSFGEPFQLEVGDQIEDVQIPFGSLVGTTTSSAEVVFYQRNFNSVRVYLKVLSGNWQQLNNIARFEIRRVRAGEPTRIIGQVDDVVNDIVLGITQGSFVVVSSENDFPVVDNPEILDSEYSIFQQMIELGAARAANFPNSLNRDFVQIYNISADEFGVPSGLQKEGVVSIYARQRNGQYRFVRALASEYQKNNKRFGSQIQFAKDGETYKLFISSQGDSNNDPLNTGSIEIYYHGPEFDEQLKGSWLAGSEYNAGDVVEFNSEYYQALMFISNQDENSIFDELMWQNISWRIAKDRNYRGEFVSTESYKQGDIVYLDDSAFTGLFRAASNIPSGTQFNLDSWIELDQKLDYLGYLPNQTGVTLFDQAVWDPDQNIDQFSSSFDVTKTGSILAVTTKQTASDSTVIKSVLIYRQFDNKYLLDQVIPDLNVVDNFSDYNLNKFADQVRISPSGEFLVISETENDDIKIDQGKVFVYQQIDGKYQQVQELISPNNEISEKFGYSISLSDDNLAIASLNGDMKLPTTFDRTLGSNTTFDRGFTNFSKTIVDSGVVYVYERLKDRLVFAEQLTYSKTKNKFGQHLLVSDNHIYVGMPRHQEENSSGLLLDYRKPKSSRSWNMIQQFRAPVDLDKIKSVFLYNKRTNQLITELDYIDPIQGKIASVADREINYKTSYDPAFYTNGIISNLVNPDLAWGDQQVGKIWWKIDSVKFTYPYFGSVQNQKNIWNQIPSRDQVEVYEWVRSSVIPSEWDRISTQQPDNERGISGTTRYGDNFFTQKFIYDEQSKSFRSEYYFWVRNKRSIPRINNRSLSVFNIRTLIEDPLSQGYRYVSFLGPDRFVINNCESLLTNDDVILSVRYRNGTKETQNRHIQYQLISDGLETSIPQPDLERKWFDSLIGFDQQTRPVPDFNLPVKQKYGIQDEPRQSMFVNRQEALKQFIERVNLILKQNLIADEYDISLLDSKDQTPSIVSGLYDVKIDTDAELRFVSTLKVKPAVLKPVISRGRIIRVDIEDPGKGYQTAPVTEIIGFGQGAEIETEINDIGEISSVSVRSRGSGYDDSTSISVRNFSVLVESDSQTRGKWSIYQWNSQLNQWQKTKVQQFDTSQFWTYIDWYDEDNNEFTPIDVIVDQTFEVDILPIRVGDVIKINNVGAGGWMLIERIADGSIRDFFNNFKVIGRQNGTIQFKDTLYNYDKNSFGYNNRSYDSTPYDNVPIQELRNIFETIKNKIFIGNLLVEYNKLFVSSLRYILSEQLYVDWLFKTSFVKIKHNVGELSQPVNFKSDSLDDYRDYVQEVKPYSTNIREFISCYNSQDNTNTKTTDFDLSPVYNSQSNKIEPSGILIADNQLFNVDEKLKSLQDQSWFDNFGFQVKEIKIVNPGSGYTLKPNVTIEGGGGFGAKAEAFLGYGSITAVRVTDPGQGYTSAPRVIIEGSQRDDGVPATAVAVIDNSVVRSANIGIRFDRIFGKYFYDNLDTVETFEGTNVTRSFDLEWPLNLRKKSIKVYINNRLLLRSEYSYMNIEDNSKSYVRQKGRIVFSKTPELGDQITVEYQKDIELLSAEDRIQFEYKPTVGMKGLDLGQLMDGVDYGGVEVTSFDFNKTEGWDLEGWDNAPWGIFNDTVEDEMFVFDGSTTNITLSKPLEQGVIYNVYLNGIRIDDPEFGTENQTNSNAVLPSIIGDNITQELDIADLGIFVVDQDELIIRKITSDGSFTPNLETYDLDLSGGDLGYQTARGISAEEIVVDGDGFVTPTTSKGPEEVVPGQVLDTLDIKVYTRPTGGNGVIYLQNQKITSSRVYDLGVIPNSSNSVIVKIDNLILDQSQYTIDWNNNKIEIDQSVTGNNLTILTLAQSGQNIVDIGRIKIDGSTQVYDTGIRYNENYSIVVLHQGNRLDTVISEDESSKNLIFGITEIKPEGDILDYIIFDGDILTNYSQMTKEQFVSDGVIKEFELLESPFFAKPSFTNVIVKVGNRILNTGYNIKYTIPETGSRVYPLENFQVGTATLSVQDLRVFLNGEEIFTPGDWTFNPIDNRVTLGDNTGISGDSLEIFVLEKSEYDIVNNKLILSQPADVGTTVEIFNFSNHDILKIDRINYEVVQRSTVLSNEIEYSTYQRLTRGEIALRTPCFDIQYVWVVKNNQLLTPNIDYFVTEEKNKVQIAKRLRKNDVIEIIHFSAPPVTPTFMFRQFKDMLNRTHYKKIDNDQTVLAKDLNYYDLRIEVADGSKLAEPNKTNNQPGIIFIDGERIEYFVKEGNLLRQLRRGTLGTGVKSIYTAGTEVYNQSSSKSIPYKDRTLTQNIKTSAGINEYSLGFDISSINDIEVFVAGSRLNKTEIKRFDHTIAQDSPEGDVTVPADYELGYEIVLDKQFVTGIFAVGKTIKGSNSFEATISKVIDSIDTVKIQVNNLSGVILPNVSISAVDEEGVETAFGIVKNTARPISIVFKNQIEQNQTVTVVKKIGKLWTEPGKTLAETDNDISDFLKYNKQ